MTRSRTVVAVPDSMMAGTEIKVTSGSTLRRADGDRRSVDCSPQHRRLSTKPGAPMAVPSLKNGAWKIYAAPPAELALRKPMGDMAGKPVKALMVRTGSCGPCHERRRPGHRGRCDLWLWLCDVQGLPVIDRTMEEKVADQYVVGADGKPKTRSISIGKSFTPTTTSVDSPFYPNIFVRASPSIRVA